MTEPLRKKLEEDSFEPEGECLTEFNRLREEAERVEEELECLKNNLKKIKAQTDPDGLVREISQKRKEAEKLGIFKKKEKEGLLSEVELLNRNLKQSRERIRKEEEIIKKKAAEARLKRSNASYFETEWKSKQRDLAREKLNLIEAFFEYRDEFPFGTYQFSYYYNNTAPIQWRIIKREGNKALLISEEALDCRAFSELHTEMTWKSSDIRNWLNTDFLAAAFSSTEQNLIQDTVIPEENVTGTEAPEDCGVTDKVFLLSSEEAELLFTSNEDRQCDATGYARMRGASVYHDHCGWWLRSLNTGSELVQFVSQDGSINKEGTFATSHLSVRPALWIDLWTALTALN